MHQSSATGGAQSAREEEEELLEGDEESGERNIFFGEAYVFVWFFYFFYGILGFSMVFPQPFGVFLFSIRQW